MASYKLTHTVAHDLHANSHAVRMENDTTLRDAFSPVTTNPRIMDDTELSEWVNTAMDAAREAYENALYSINLTEQIIAKQIVK